MTKPKCVEGTRRRPSPAAEAEARDAEKGKTAEALRRRRRAGARAAPVGSRARAPRDEDDARGKKKGAKPAKSPVKAAEERRERIKLTINNAFDEAQRERSLASLRRKREREKLRRPASSSRATRSCAK